MIINLILSIVTIILSSAALYFYVLAYKRFLKGEFSSFVKWMMWGMTFFLIHTLLHIVHMFEYFGHEIIEILIYVFMLVTVLFFVKATFVLNI
jgi:hypothetical protein